MTPAADRHGLHDVARRLRQRAATVREEAERVAVALTALAA